MKYSDFEKRKIKQGCAVGLSSAVILAAGLILNILTHTNTIVINSLNDTQTCQSKPLPFSQIADNTSVALGGNEGLIECSGVNRKYAFIEVGSAILMGLGFLGIIFSIATCCKKNREYDYYRSISDV